MTAQPTIAAALEHYRAGRLAEAGLLCREILAARPEDIAALNLSGVTACRAGRLEDGISCFRRAITAAPNQAEAYLNLGNALKAQGQLEEAVANWQIGLGLKPDLAELHHEVGNALKMLGRLDEAVASYRRALAIRPDQAAAWTNLGAAFAEKGETGAAIAAHRRAAGLAPGLAEAHSNLAAALNESGEIDEAIGAAERAIVLAPNFAAAHFNLGYALKERGEIEAAIASYRRALALQPDLPQAHFNLAYALLLKRHDAEGWREYEWRWKGGVDSKIPRGLPGPPWEGEELGGKTLFLYTEQGLGDTLQFVRFLPGMAGSGARVVLEAPRSLVALLQLSGLGATVIAQGTNLPAYDFHLPLLSLPVVLGTTEETLPCAVPYLAADPERVAAWRERLPQGGYRIGVVWQGQPNAKIDKGRSFPLRALAPIAAVPGVRLISLQKNHGLEQISALPEDMRIEEIETDLDTGPDAFLDTAAVMMSLDLVITCDTSVAHLAGALARPVWIALKHVPDWRWLLAGDDSPWYPTARLFRQRRRGDWDDVFDRMAAALASLVAPHPRITSGADSPAGADLSAGPLARGEGPEATSEALAAALQYYNAGKLDEAERRCCEVLTVGPDNVTALNLAGVIACRMGRLEEGTVSFRRALALAPASAEAHINLGVALQMRDKPDEALAHYQLALALAPGSAEIYSNLGARLHALGRPHEAVASYERAVALRPDFATAHKNLAHALLQLGDFSRGWREYEWRWQTEAQPIKFLRPLWTGEPLAGRTILLYSEQGLGDTIQFLRYVPLVAAKGGRVVLGVPQRMARLASSVKAQAQVVAEVGPSLHFDLCCPLFSLPAIFGTTIATVPADIPYLSADMALVAGWRDRIGEGPRPKVGLAWAGNPHQVNNRHRSIAFERWRAVLEVPGISWVSLQIGERAADLAALPPGMLTDLSPGVTDFADTAAIIADLDLVVTVDTAVAHLSGALGKPVWILLPFVADWRWLRERDDSPWYPTARLFRQRRHGDWEEVLQRVAAELAAFAAPRAPAVAGSSLSVRGQGQVWGEESFAAALRHYHAGRLDEAARLCRDILITAPNNISALNLAGIIACRAGSPEQGSDYFNRALAVAPERAELQLNLANALKEEGRLEEAAERYRRAIALRPKLLRETSRL